MRHSVFPANTFAAHYALALRPSRAVRSLVFTHWTATLSPKGSSLFITRFKSLAFTSLIRVFDQLSTSYKSMPFDADDEGYQAVT